MSKREGLGGAFGSLVACTTLQPLDVRLQQSKSQKTGIIKIGKEIINRESVFGLWRGTVATLWRNVPGGGLYFVVLSKTRNVLKSFKVEQNISSLLSGAFSRALVGFVFMPVSVLKVRYESSLYHYTSLLQAFKSIYQTEGFRGFFSGYGATALRDAPYAGFDLEINSASGLTAGLAATSIVHPFDVLKTRIQLEPRKYSNLVFASTEIAKTEGISALFAGFVPRALRRTLSAAITWTIYEEFIKH